MTDRRRHSSMGRLALVASLIVGPQGASPAFAQEEAAPTAATGGDLVGYNSIHRLSLGRDAVVAQSKTAARIGGDPAPGRQRRGRRGGGGRRRDPDPAAGRRPRRRRLHAGLRRRHQEDGGH